MYCTENTLVLLYFLVHCYLEQYYLIFWEEKNSVMVVSASNTANRRQMAVGKYIFLSFDARN